MTAQETREAAKLMTEYATSVEAGKPIEIECRTRVGDHPWESTSMPIWDFYGCEYRKKPTPAVDDGSPCGVMEKEQQ